jgi:hypothetical protein
MKPQMTSVHTLTLLAAVAAISGFWSSGLQAQTPTQTQTQIYGSQLMTDAERVEFQTKMRSLKTDKERDALRLDQINKMNLRATEKGITLQHTPPAAGSGPRSSAGAAGGANSGLGTGQGGSPNSSGGGKVKKPLNIFSGFDRSHGTALKSVRNSRAPKIRARRCLRF